MHQQPFAPAMVRDAQYFVGRWGEIQQVVEALERRTPALVVGPAASGRSSLLYHVVAAAPVLFDETELVAHYIDVAGFPDIDAIETTIAQAFQQPISQWLRMLPGFTYPPLLAFDNVDVAHLATTMPAWWQRLMPAIRAGHLRCVAATHTVDTAIAWRVVPMRPIVGATLNELVVAALGEDGTRLSRSDQEWVMRQSQGHMGQVVALLARWHQSGYAPTWRAGLTHTPGASPAWPTGEPTSSEATTWEMVEAPEMLSSTTVSPQDDQDMSRSAVRFEVPSVLWWLAGAMLVVLVLWWWLKGW